jgi:hypothetical protein
MDRQGFSAPMALQSDDEAAWVDKGVYTNYGKTKGRCQYALEPNRWGEHGPERVLGSAVAVDRRAEGSELDKTIRKQKVRRRQEG